MFRSLEIKNLSILSKNTFLVKNINLSIKRGTPLVLLGESGSGKSLIIDAVMGTLAQGLESTGKILLDDIDLLKLSLEEKKLLWGKTMALLPQEPWRALDPTMRIINQVSEVYEYIHNDKIHSKEKALNNLKDLSLDDFNQFYPFELSGGMCQRTIISITRAFNSQVILVDEPTKGLDRELCTSVVNSLKKEIKDNKLLFVISHDIELAKSIKGNLGIILDGKLVEYGKSEEIFSNPKHTYTKKLFQSQSSKWEIEKASNFNEIIMEAKNISKNYGKNILFKNINLILKRGEVTAIVGRSGSGKSTLGNILLGLTKASSGSINKLKDLNQIEFQKIYQDPPSAFLPNQILKEGFEDLVKIHKLDMNKVYDFFIKFKLKKDILHRKAHEVSGGELQRMSIIKVLLLKPAFIFADEITSRLDSINQQEIIYLLLEFVKKEKLSLLFISHDLSIAEKISNNIIHLK